MSFEASFLEVFHHAGAASKTLAICGAAAEAAGACEAGRADLVLLAPTRAECRKAGWLAGAIDRALAALAPDGLLCAAAPRPWLSDIARRLRSGGLELSDPFAQVGTCLVPLRAAPLQAAVEAWPAARRWSHVARLLARFPGSKWRVASILPQAVLLAHRPGFPPLSWLKGLLPGSDPLDAVLAPSWRGPEGGAVALLFGRGGERPLAAAKRPADRLRGRRPDEGELLDLLGNDARAAGMDVPRLLGRQQPDWLVQGHVPGVPLCRLLSGGSGDPALATARVAEWLARWNVATVSRRPLTPDAAERHILAPARKVCADLDNGGAWFDRLEDAAAALLWQDVAFVAAHNDLTMANVLQAPDGRLALVDWEMAQPLGLPLADFWYSACDAVAATDHYADRAGAFAQCFVQGGRHGDRVKRQETGMRQGGFGPPAWIDLCFHACWLGHAANEQATSKPGDERPFLAIARLIAEGGEFALQQGNPGYGDLCAEPRQERG